MVEEYDIDTKRVYMSGFSMGGMLTYHAMSKIADKIAAFAPTSGTNVMGASRAMRPVPIFHPHGTTDDVLGYNQVEGFIKNYRDQFNCPAQADVQDNYPHQGEKATLYSWGPCDDGVYIKHMKLEGRGHMPSKNEVSDIWNFVKEYSLDGANITPPIVVPTNRDTVFNGTFSDSLKLAGWTLQQHSGEGSLKLTEGKAEINVTKVGTNAYDVQMIQKGMHYEKGEKYKLTFEAYASSARTLEVNLEKDTDPWTSYLGEAKTFELGTEKKTYEIEFTMQEPTDEDARISFNAGLATGSVFIDNVVFSKSDGLTGFVNRELQLSTEKSFSVYNVKGAFVGKLKASRVGDIQTGLNKMNLDKGLYVVKDGSFKKVFSVK